MFPAPAGMNRVSARLCTINAGVPRACGDEPVGIIVVEHMLMCSPRLRG